MGGIESSDYESSPPPPSPRHSTLYVVRNGRYEPQNLMPRLPQSDTAEFDGFRQSTGRIPVRPPDLKQASLVKNPVSLRRDSLLCSTEHESSDGETKDAEKSQMCFLSFVFDATTSGTLTMHYRVTESLETNDSAAETENKESAVQANGESDEQEVSFPFELLPQQDILPANGNQQEHATSGRHTGGVIAGAVLDTLHFQAGLGQKYRSPPLDLDKWPAELLGYDEDRRRDVPLAMRLQADPEEEQPTTVQYTYISFRNAAAVVPLAILVHDAPLDDMASEVAETPLAQDIQTPEVATNQDCPPPRPIWRAEIFAQKLQYGDQRFVLHDVFGVRPKSAQTHETEENNDCIICLSEPRDTAVLPCRHMCFCNYCAGIVRLQCEKCPVCRQKVVSLLQFKRRDSPADLGLPLSSPQATPASTNGRKSESASAAPAMV